MNKKQKIADLKFGLDNELKILDKIKVTINPKLEKTKNKYSSKDFECDDCFCELKTRRIGINTYKDIMIGANKIDDAIKCGKDYYIIYSLTDGDYMYKFNIDDLNNNKIKKGTGGNFARGDKVCDVYYVDTCLLVKF